jgi:lysozyme
VEAHYGVKPIIYTGDSYFQDNLDGNDFHDYPLWIANYNLVRKPKTNHWVIWQFSEKGEMSGIKGKVDLNVLRGGKNALDNLLISE